MKIKVLAKPNSKKERIEVIDNETLRVYVTCAPVNDKANSAIIELLAKYYNVPKSSICILSGQKSKTKIIEISRE